MTDLTLAIITINGWNRFAIGFRKTPLNKDGAVQILYLSAMRLVGFLFAVSTTLSAIPASAHDQVLKVEKDEERVVVQRQQSLPDAPGKKVVLLTVEYAPGQVSAPHVHPGSVIAYVLEGKVVSQLGGEAPVTYKAGESWYEPPRAPHLVSRNGSKTKPAKLLVWLMGGEGEQIKEPLPAQ